MGAGPRNRPAHSHAASEKLNSVVRVVQTGPPALFVFHSPVFSLRFGIHPNCQIKRIDGALPFPKVPSSMSATRNRYQADFPLKIRALTLDYTPGCSV